MGHLALTAAVVAGAYYAGANLGFLLRVPSATPSLLWPPNTILTAALLVSPPRRWGLYLLAALPAHLAAELGMGWPAALVLALYVTNCSQALIAAAGTRWLSDAPARFDTLRRVTVFILAAGLVAPFLSSFLDAAAVTVVQGAPYWLVWRMRFFSNALTELILGPAIVLALTAGPAWLRGAPRARKIEAALLVASLALAGEWTFGVLADSPGVISGESAVVLLLPLILLATVRFGPGGASLALLGTALFAVSAGVRSRGPFAGLPLTETEMVLEAQVLLIAVAIPILCLAAVIAERREATRALAERLRLEVALSRLSAAFVRLPANELDPALETAVRQVGEAAGVDRVVLCWYLKPYGRVARYAWSVPGSDRGLDILPEEQFPWTVEELRREQVVVFSCLEDLPVAAAHDVESFRRYGVRSGIIVPLMGGTRVSEALSLVTVSTERTWREGLVQWVRLAAEIFASALARKEADDALRASESSKSAILASLSNAVAVLDRDGWIIDVNARWTRAVAEPDGPAPAGLGMGVNLLDGFRQAGNELPHAREAAAAIQDVLRGERSEFTIEYSSRGAAQEPWFVMSVVPLDRAEGGAVVSCTEITERKRAELDAQRSRQELTHFTRLATMGELTASIAHELNQPLAAILANARAGVRFLDATPPDLDELRDILRDIGDADKRAAEVIQRLRGLARKDEPQRALLDLNALVRDVVRLLGSDAIIRNATVTLALAADPVLVYADRIEIQQVVLNLLLNAMDAITEAAGGDRTIVVTTEIVLGETVHVAVRDSGSGLRPGCHDLLFKPFFTTKPAGMGMGLAIAGSIIEAHGGAIWATDNHDGGAVFHFMLPAGRTESQ